MRAFPSSAINPDFGGMELRDWFAGQALSGLLSDKDIMREFTTVARQLGIDEDAAIAKSAYVFADAMLAIRKGKGTSGKETQ